MLLRNKIAQLIAFCIKVFSPLAIGTGWVAWLRDTFQEKFVELIFEFEAMMIFEAVHIYTNNYFSRDVQVIFNSLLRKYIFHSRTFMNFSLYEADENDYLTK